ncbi:MAG: hypothetical protein ACLFRG_22830 [Desulfococcaceae bacterium]
MDRRLVRALMGAPALDFIGRFAGTENEEYGLYAYGLDRENLVVFQIGEDDGEVYEVDFYHDGSDLDDQLKHHFDGCFTYLHEGQQEFDELEFSRMVKAILAYFN